MMDANFVAQFRKFYGRYNRTPPVFNQCAASISGGNYGAGLHQCARKNGHGPHGAWCKQHDPVAVKAKREISDAKWRAKYDAAQRQRKFTAEAKDAVRAIAAGHNDPRGLCAEILARLNPEGGL